MNKFRKFDFKNRRHLSSLLLILFLVLAIPLTVLLTLQSRDQRSKASSLPEQETSETTFLSNQVLIKVKKEARGKVKENPSDTGIAALNAIGKQIKIKSFEKIAKAGKESSTNADLFSWYLLKLDDLQEKVVGKLDSADQKIKLPQNTKNNASKVNPYALAQVQRVIDKLKNDPSVEAIDLNYVVNVLAVPNDPYYSSNGSWGQAYDDLWGIKKIDAATAWDQTTGSTGVIVADVDTGVDRNHEDIAANMWVNSKEIPGNGIDDDGNGYIDDYYGWNWVAGNGDPMDDYGHGTHTVGTIAGVGNNGKGVVGVNWTSKIMALKFLNSSGSGYLDDGIKALQYAADMGARVSSNSWGCGCPSAAMDDAVKYEHDRGMVVATAAGNSNSDALDFSPAGADYAITVAASDPNDAKASFSNWGEKIDVAAPGVDILSARASNNPMCTAARTVGTNYCRVSGTSMATPHVAGLVALLLAKNPSLNNEELRQIIRGGSVDLGTGGKDRDFGYGRISASGAMNLANTHPLTPVLTSPTSRTVVSGTAIEVNGSIGGPNFASYKLELGAGNEPTSWSTLANSTTQPTTNSLLATFDSIKFEEGPYIIRLTAVDTSNRSYQFQVNAITIDNFDVGISFPRSAVSLGTIDILGIALTKGNVPFQNYKIEWANQSSPNTWSATGITLVNGGLQPVENGKIGSWDTSGLINGQIYTLRLTVNSTLNISNFVTTQVTADKDILPGWPKAIPGLCQFCENQIVDLDGDGTKEVIISGTDGKLYVFRKDGNAFPGFPINIGPGGDGGGSPMNIEDLDKDGKKEIIINGSDAKVYIVKSNGILYPGWVPSEMFNNFNHVPLIVDLDGNGTKDIVDLKITNNIWFEPVVELTISAMNLDSSQLAGFPKIIVHTKQQELDSVSYAGMLSAVDLDGDGNVELAWPITNIMFLFDNKGNLLPGWPFYTPRYSTNNKIMQFYSAAAAGDIDGDGKQELFVGASAGGCLVCETHLYGLRKDGTMLPGWPKTDADGIKIPWYRVAMPSLTDIDGDGKDEVIVGYDSLAIFDETGKKPLSGSIGSQTQPALVDVDGDGQIDMVTSNYNTVTAAKQNGTSFSSYWQKTAGTWFLGPVAVADMDNNGKMEVMATSRGYDYPGATETYLWEIPTTSGSAKYEWPMFGLNPARTGRLILGGSPTSTPTPTPNPDTTAPTTTINSPTNGSNVSGTISVTASATDNVGVTKVELYKSGILFKTSTTSPYSFSWDTTKEVNGSVSLQTLAYDSANNTGVSNLVTVNVANPDTTLPSVTITNPTNGATISGVVNITANASDNVGVTSVQFLVDNNPAVADVASSYNFSWDTTKVSNGTHTLTAIAYDAAGNSKTSSPVNVTVNNLIPNQDTTPPTVSITSPLNGGFVLRNSKVTIIASASDNVGVSKVVFSVANTTCTDTTTPYTCLWKVGGKPGASYVITARAYDAAGNTTLTTITVKSK